MDSKNKQLPDFRSGYTISRKRKLLWGCELEILEFFKKICKQNSLGYFLIGGSAIGAVRHKGFVPWDDDLDIGMIRSDFERLYVLLQDNLPDYYSVEYGVLSDGVVSFLLRIRDNRTTGIVRDEYIRHHAGGIFIEIYPFDEVSQARLIWKLQLTLSSQIAFMLAEKNTDNKFKGRLRALQALSKHISTETLWKYFQKICKYFDGKNTGNYNRPGSPKYATRMKHYSKKQMMETICVPFEYTTVNIQKDYDTALREMFHEDYMKMPPKADREKHHQSTVYYDPTMSFNQALDVKFLDSFFDLNKDILG